MNSLPTVHFYHPWKPQRKKAIIRSMIIGRSKDPVNLKKIPVRIWSLKHEIAVTLAYYKANHPEEYEQVKVFYETKHTHNEEPIIDEGDTSPTDSPESNEKSEEVAEEANASAEESGDENNVVDINTGQPSIQMSQEECVAMRSKIKRVIPDKDQLAHGHLFLFDVTMNHVLFFTDKQFKPGQTVVVEFNIDRGFTLIAEVDYVKHVGIKSRIITEYPPHYRLRCFWTLDNPGDRSLLRKFLSSLGNDSSAKTSTQADAMEAGEDEVVIDEGADFDLGDLGGL